jgi:hypothetical protein
MSPALQQWFVDPTVDVAVIADASARAKVNRYLAPQTWSYGDLAALSQDGEADSDSQFHIEEFKRLIHDQREKIRKKTASRHGSTRPNVDDQELLTELREHMLGYKKLQDEHEQLEKRYKEALECVAT